MNLRLLTDRLAGGRSGQPPGAAPTVEEQPDQPAIPLLDAEHALKRERLLSKITSSIHSSLDADEVLQSIVDELGQALSACRCRLAKLSEPESGSIPISHTYTASCCAARPPAFERLPAANNPFLDAVLNSTSPVAVDDVFKDPRLRHARSRFKRTGIRSLLSVAIRIDGVPVGILNLQHCESLHRWTDWETSLVRKAAEQAAVAIRQAELYREVKESATRAALVNQIITSIRRSLDLNETLRVAVEEVGRALGANRTYFRKLVNDRFEAVAEFLSDPALSLKTIAPSANDYIANFLTMSRSTLVIDDVQAFVSANPQLAKGVAVWQVTPCNLSQINCPIFLSGRFWGYLDIGQTDVRRKWTAAEVALVETVTAQIEVAVSHSNLFNETKQTADREGLISHITHGLNQSNHIDEIFPLIARELGDHLAVDRLVISRFLQDAGKMVIEYLFEQGNVTTAARVLDENDFAVVADFRDDDVLQCDDVNRELLVQDPFGASLVSPAGARSFMAIRLRHKGKLRLVVSAIMTSGTRHWTAEEYEVVRAAVDHVFIALQRAELFEQVLQGKHQWEATFDALTDGVLMFDRNGKLVRVNLAGAAFEGAEVKELIGRQCCSLMQGAEAEACRVAQVISTGRLTTFELVPGRLGRPVLVTMSPLWENNTPAYERSAGVTQSPVGAVCVVRDLSELRAAEAVAREQRNFLVKLIEHANDAIFAFSPDGRLVWFNEQLVTLSGFTRFELSKADYRLLISGDEKKVAVERFGRALIGEPQTFEVRASQKNGDQRLLMMTFSPIYDEGGVTSVLAIARDVTEERLAAERAAQADKLRALGQLASGVAHNFNNILAAIVGHSQLLKRDCDDEGLAQRIDIIERAALDGAETVKRIQAFGVQQNEGIGEVVDMSKVAHDSTELTRARWCDEAQARGLHYEVDLHLKEVPVVRGSASELREVFVNLILNALDAMPQGGKIRISTDTYGPNVRAVLTDTGIGMSHEVIEHIYEPFFTTKGASGMGLGLAVTYSIIERHGGRIEVASALGRGTTFTITIPMAEAPKHKPGLPRRIKSRASSVLVIDDDERVREVLVGMVNSAGHQTEWACSAREGLAKMELGRFDLVFTDLSMPEMDGWTLATEIRRGWPSAKIVLITGYGVSPDTVRHYRELVDDVVFKPIRLEDIAATLSQVLS